MFERKHALTERSGGVAVQDFYGVLEYNGPMVVFFVDEVDGDARNFGPIVKYRLMDSFSP